MPETLADRPRRVVVGSDIAHATASAVASHLEDRGCAVVRAGGAGGPDTPWPDVAEHVGRLVAQGAVDQGVLCCWTGTGVSIAANKVSGVRAALCADAATASGARRWNDANVLALSLASTDVAQARLIVDAWLEVAGPDPDEAANIARIDELERRYRDGPPGSGE
jgi:ribose 5-phosphate isomerase B